jgi:hypothetical protein
VHYSLFLSSNVVSLQKLLTNEVAHSHRKPTGVGDRMGKRVLQVQEISSLCASHHTDHIQSKWIEQRETCCKSWKLNYWKRDLNKALMLEKNMVRNYDLYIPILWKNRCIL